MLYSVAGGSVEPWARRQALRFGVGLALMVVIALIDIRFWRRMAPLAYAGALVLLVAVEVAGETGMGAQRWLKLGPLRLQPSELMKIAVVMMLASYYGLARSRPCLAPGLGRAADPSDGPARPARAQAARSRHRSPDRGGRDRGDLHGRRLVVVLPDRDGGRDGGGLGGLRLAGNRLATCSRTTSSAASRPS